MIDLQEKAMDWEDETVWQRLVKCRRMLYTHGLLSQSQAQRITERMNEEWKKQCRDYCEGLNE